MRVRSALAASLITMVAVLGVVRGGAQDLTPSSSPTTMTMVEHADRVTSLDNGQPGQSVGDVIVWGPDPLFDEADRTDTGATSQGTCVTFGDDGACMLNETILFPDGSTIELYGIQAGGSDPSTRTIIGGSGMYRGATGSVTVIPSADLTTFTKTFELYR